ncbi:hypothetical protein GCM10009416_02250 [Craurococcus roseus]|uniref:Uncharacterized protein n=1 Tax=Craurococcus roseus TaxID=77585 RepID=A0ABP3PP29_9PROT
MDSGDPAYWDEIYRLGWMPKLRGRVADTEEERGDPDWCTLLALPWGRVRFDLEEGVVVRTTVAGLPPTPDLVHGLAGRGGPRRHEAGIAAGHADGVRRRRARRLHGLRGGRIGAGVRAARCDLVGAVPDAVAVGLSAPKRRTVREPTPRAFLLVGASCAASSSWLPSGAFPGSAAEAGAPGLSMVAGTKAIPSERAPAPTFSAATPAGIERIGAAVEAGYREAVAQEFRRARAGGVLAAAPDAQGRPADRVGDREWRAGPWGFADAAWRSALTAEPA